MGGSQDQGQPIKAQLSLWDAVSIIIGIVIGSTIFKTPPIIFQNVSSPWMGLGFWLLGGILALIGALCYAELATAYPRSGGDYVYLTRAFGPPVGFLFGWAQLAVILTGSIGAMAYIFAEYAVALFHKVPEQDIPATVKQALEVRYAVGAVLVLSACNVAGVVFGKHLQNVLSVAKVIGLVGIILAGFFWSQPGAYHAAAWDKTLPIDKGIGVALILVFYAYGGWNDAAFVAAEVRDKRDLPRALLLGTGAITLIYLAVNAAYLLGLGFEGARQFRPVAADVLRATPLGEWGFKAMAVLVMVAALGAVNGLIFTGARVYSSLGSEHPIFGWLARWHPKLGTPLWALLAQAVICLALILAVGTQAGNKAIDDLVTSAGLPAIPWAKYFGGFETLFAGTAPVFWFFFLLTGISLFVLRWKDPHVERPFKLRIPFFPLLPLIFCGMCVFGLYSAIRYAQFVALIGVVPLLIGIPLYLLSSLWKARNG